MLLINEHGVGDILWSLFVIFQKSACVIYRIRHCNNGFLRRVSLTSHMTHDSFIWE